MKLAEIALPYRFGESLIESDGKRVGRLFVNGAGGELAFTAALREKRDNVPRIERKKGQGLTSRTGERRQDVPGGGKMFFLKNEVEKRLAAKLPFLRGALEELFPDFLVFLFLLEPDEVFQEEEVVFIDGGLSLVAIFGIWLAYRGMTPLGMAATLRITTLARRTVITAAATALTEIRTTVLARAAVAPSLRTGRKTVAVPLETAGRERLSFFFLGLLEDTVEFLFKKNKVIRDFLKLDGKIGGRLGHVVLLLGHPRNLLSGIKRLYLPDIWSPIRKFGDDD